MYFVYVNWGAMIRLRHAYFRSPEYMQSFYARTLLVQRVPKKLQSDEGLKSLFASLNVPYPATSVHISRRVGRLPELIKYHNDAVRDLEAVLVRYLKHGKIASRRRTVTVGGFLGIGGTKKVRWHVRRRDKVLTVVAYRMRLTSIGGQGLLGLNGPLTRRFSNRIRNAERSIQEARAQIEASQAKAENHGFASMAAVSQV